MARKSVWFLFLICLSVIPGLAAGREAYGHLPLSFEPNLGQTDPQVRFVARGSGFGLFLTEDEAVLSLTQPRGVLRLRLEGQRPNPAIEGIDQLPGSSHYLKGNNRGEWTGGVPNYAKVRYREVYPGIDVEYYGNQRQLEYDFIVAAGADPASILLRFDGAEHLEIDTGGDLVVQTSGGEIRQKKPVVYQEIDGIRKPVEGSYVLRGEARAGFSLAGYDHAFPVVIDPILIYSSYFGGFAESGLGDQGFAVAVDAQGNAYLTGYTSSINFPAGGSLDATPGGGLDAFVLKLSAAGDNTFFSTYIGGAADDEGHSIALDGDGNIFVAGYTSSSDFPVANAFRGTRGGNRDAFVLKMSNSGTELLFSTFLGGSLDDQAFGVATDPAGSVYVAGMTASTNFPTVNPLQQVHGGGLGDIFITKLTATGSVAYSTFLGGRGHDQAYAIAVNAAGNAYITGYTTSTNFPVVKAFQPAYGGGTDDVVVAELNPAGNAAVFATYLGGLGSDNGVRLAVDIVGCVYVTGYTSSDPFPLLNPLQDVNLGSFDAFVTKFAPDGTSLIFSTFIGGLGSEGGVGIAVDRKGSAYVTGFTTSFEIRAINAVQLTKRGDQDAFVFKLSPEGTSFLYSTYLGGDGVEGGLGVALDAADNLYVTGYTTSTNFPVVNPLQPESAGGKDGFIVKINADDVRDSALFGIPAQGFATLSTGANNDQAVFGFATAEASAGSLPAGIAMIGRRGLGGLVTEVAVPAPALISEGRMFVEVSATVRSVLSLANPTAEAVPFEFYFTDQSGVSSFAGSDSVAAGTQLSRFVSDPPYNIPLDSIGTLSIHASAPLAMAAFGTTANEESNLLLHATQIAEIRIPDDTPTMIPHFADGLGWGTRVILVNPSEDRMNGEIRFFGPGSAEGPGGPIEIVINDVPASVFEFDIPGRSFQEFQTSAAGEILQTGWVQILPFPGSRTPAGHAVLTFVYSGVTVSKAGVNATVPSRSARLIAEASGDFESGEALTIRTGVAVSNPANVPAEVRLELLTPAGQPSGVSASITVPALGQYVAFLHQIPGFETVAAPYQGVLLVTTTSPSGISAVGMRGRYNELGRFLATTTGPFIEDGGSSGLLIFPHIAEGSGYSTQFILLGGPGGPSNGTLRMFDQQGQPLRVTLR